METTCGRCKNQLSYKEEYPILTNLYDEYGGDDEGEEFEIDLTITREVLKGVIAPFIQKAIDYSKVLLKGIIYLEVH